MAIASFLHRFLGDRHCCQGGQKGDSFEDLSVYCGFDDSENQSRLTVILSISKASKRVTESEAPN